jgi:pimeloyl-ACP methyl ester carboxylesterase
VNRETYHPFRSEKAKEQYLNYYDKKAEKWPVDSKNRTVDTNYGQTFMRISGSADAPVLVLLPGVSASSLMWKYSVKALSEHYCVYAIDNIYDVGRSVYTRRMRSSEDFVNWLNELFTTLELGNKVNLMGLSYGGWLTAKYAVKHPERLNKIVLIAPAATVLQIRQAFYRRVMLCLIPHRWFVENLMYWLLKDAVNRHKAYREQVDRYIDEVMLSNESFKQKATVNPTVLDDDELKSLVMPVLFLVGENEKIYSARNAIDRLKNVAPQIKTEIISNVGHDLLFLEQSLVLSKILTFLKNPVNN